VGVFFNLDKKKVEKVKVRLTPRKNEWDEAGLKYREISGIDIFSDMGFSSLRRLYRLSKEYSPEFRIRPFSRVLRQPALWLPLVFSNYIPLFSYIIYIIF